MKNILDLNTFIISLIKIWKGDDFKSFFLLAQRTGFGLHVVSLVIGAGSSLMFLVVVAMFVFLLRRKKW